MWKDKIVEDVRKVRKEHAEKFDYDLDAICKDLKKQEKRSKRKILSFSAKRTKATAKASQKSTESFKMGHGKNGKTATNSISRQFDISIYKC